MQFQLQPTKRSYKKGPKNDFLFRILTECSYMVKLLELPTNVRLRQLKSIVKFQLRQTKFFYEKGLYKQNLILLSHRAPPPKVKLLALLQI